jgi:alpha-galactosidase
MNFGISLELALLMFSIHPTFSEISKAEEWIVSNLGEAASAMPFSFRYGDASSNEMIGKWKREHTSEKLDEYSAKQAITFTEPDTGLAIRVESVIYRDFPAVEWVLYIKNTGSSDTPILEKILPLDTLFSLHSPAKLHYARGALCCIDDFAPMEEELNAGKHLHFQPGGGRSSSEIMPFFNLDMDKEGDMATGVVMAIGWTGEWVADFISDDESNLRIQAGMASTHLKLHPSEEIRTPRILMLFWKGEPIRGNNLLRRFILAHHRPKPDGKPIVLPVILSGWGGDTAESHMGNIQRIIEHDLPVSLYWIDAEWFGQKPWHENTGNWTVRKELYPQGFKPISDMLHNSNRKFLLWLEPQRVCKGTLWYELKNRPDWLLELGNGVPEYKQRNINWGIPHEDTRWIIYESRRSQIAEDDILFNMGNPEAREFLTDFLSEKIVEFGLDWYREDFNIAPLEYWQHADAPDRQGITEIRYIEGLYKMWDELLRRYPHLMIDNCASGGRRIDLETISRSTALWRTDWPVDSVHKQCHTFGLLQWVPLNMSSGSVLKKRNEYELRSSMTAGLMVQLWERDTASDEEKAKDARELIIQYLNIQKYFYGDYYPLTAYSTARDVWIAWQLDLPEIGEGMIQAFRRENCPQESSRLILKGLEENSKYTLTNLDSSDSYMMTGKELMEIGLNVGIKQQPGSLIILYKPDIRL